MSAYGWPDLKGEDCQEGCNLVETRGAEHVFRLSTCKRNV